MTPAVANKGCWKGWGCVAIAALALGLSEGSVRAATYGVPTNLNADGTTSGTSANPQGWFYLTSTDSPGVDGELVHQVRLFIEVTGTTLDVRVFDPGISDARDEDADNDMRMEFRLLNPCTPFPTCAGTVRSQTVNFNNDTASTDNRLARFTPGNNGFFNLNNNNGNNVPFTGLTPGLYEFRITSVATGDDDVNFFGVDIRDQAGDSLNVYTIGRTPAEDSGFVTGTNNTSEQTPPPNITQPIRFFPFVDRGCTTQPSNFDMDVSGTPGGGAAASILDVSGVTTNLVLSGDATHAETTVVVEPTSGVNTESTNYGMFQLDNNTGSQRNWLEWRVADFQGWSDNPANAERNPNNPIRMYLPNRNAITGTGVLAPSEPVLRTSLQYISGPNPPTPGQATRFGIYGHLDNLSGTANTNGQM